MGGTQWLGMGKAVPEGESLNCALACHALYVPPPASPLSLVNFLNPTYPINFQGGKAQQGRSSAGNKSIFL